MKAATVAPLNVGAWSPAWQLLAECFPTTADNSATLAPDGQRIPIGIVTDRDIALALVDWPDRVAHLAVGDVMSTNLVMFQRTAS